MSKKQDWRKCYYKAIAERDAALVRAAKFEQFYDEHVSDKLEADDLRAERDRAQAETVAALRYKLEVMAENVRMRGVLEYVSLLAPSVFADLARDALKDRKSTSRA